MSNKVFHKTFDTTERDAKQSCISEMGIAFNNNGLPLYYDTSVRTLGAHRGGSKLQAGSPHVKGWIDTSGEIRHLLRSKRCNKYIELFVDSDNNERRANITINPTMQEYEKISQSLIDNGWKQTIVRGRRTRLPTQR